MIQEIKENEFEKVVLAEKGPIYVDFYATWCGPCKMLAPIMEAVSATHKVVKIDVDQAGDLAREFGVMSIPCVILFKDGKEAARSIGMKSKDQILAMVQE